MPTIRGQFGGLNTDLPLVKLPSGSASVALNVTLADGKLAKRMGFEELEDDVSGGSETEILNMSVAHFRAGTWIVCKLADGSLWARRVYTLDSVSFAELTGHHTHSATDAGSFFSWADRLIYGDTGGVSQWHPYAFGGFVMKAGLPKPASGPVVAAADNGEKDGKYHCYYSYYNSNLDVEGIVSEPSQIAGPAAGAVETRISDGKGGLSFSSYTAYVAGYEYDKIRVYCSMGDTEIVEVAGTERNTFTYRAYMDAEVALATTPGLNKSDEALDKTKQFTNEGGEPPAATLIAWTGGVAVYAGCDTGTAATLTLDFGGGDNSNVLITANAEGFWGNRISVVVTKRADTNSTPTVTVTQGDGVNARNGIKIAIEVNDGAGDANDTTGAEVTAAINGDTDAATAVTASDVGDGSGYARTAEAEAFLSGGVDAARDTIYYSKFGRPTMVPQLQTYTASTGAGATTDSKTFVPIGGHHVIASGLDGEITELREAGGTVVAYTDHSTWVMRSTPDGHLYPVKRNAGIGCVAHMASANLGFEAHALGYRAWTITTAQNFRNIAHERFTTTLEEIPVAQQHKSRMAAYEAENQVWCAVVKSGETLCRRILVMDRGRAELPLVAYDFADDIWETNEEITALCEMKYLGSEPMMLVATSEGRIFKYPGTYARDHQASGYADYEARWRGVFAVEASEFAQKQVGVEVHAGAACKDTVQYALRARRAEGDDPSWNRGFLAHNNEICTLEGAGDRVDGRFFELELCSTAEDTGQWTVYDVTFKTERTDLMRR